MENYSFKHIREMKTTTTVTCTTWRAAMMLLATLLTASTAWAQDTAPDAATYFGDGDGSATNPYVITTTDGWNFFCDCLEDPDTWNHFTGKTIVLDEDIDAERMAGHEGNDFSGTFNGQGHTITANMVSDEGSAAPFREIRGATICNLIVVGTVSGKRHTAGLVSFARGEDATVENTIENCLVAADVSINNDRGYLGGIVGHGLKSKLTIRGCAFTGSLTSPSYYTGGIQGWSDGNTLVLQNDFFVPKSVEAANVGFHPIAFHNNNSQTTATESNVYYTVAPTCNVASRIAANGQQALSIPAGEHVTVSPAGTATVYDVSGITAFTDGIMFDNVLYAGSGQSVPLTLFNDVEGAPHGYCFADYIAGGGTLTDVGFCRFNLDMPQEDVVITLGTGDTLCDMDWELAYGGNTADDAYMIYTPNQLNLLAYRVNGSHGQPIRGDGYAGKFFRLGNDIAFSYDSEWYDTESTESNYEGIGKAFLINYHTEFLYFQGNFDGAGHTVSGIRIYSYGGDLQNGCKGIFGSTGGQATIHDLVIADSRITANVSVGGIVGENSGGTITRCHAAADVAIHAVGEGGLYFFGGIVGRNLENSTLSFCTSSATLSFIGGNIKHNYGGIAGINYGTMSDNLAIGATVPQTTINVHGAVVGQVGQNSTGTLLRNYYSACRVASENVTPSGVGCKSADVTKNDGAVPGFFLTLDEGISANVTSITVPEHIVLDADGEKQTVGTVTYNVAAAGANIVLTVRPPAGSHLVSLSCNGTEMTPVEGVYSFTMPAEDVTIAAQWEDGVATGMSNAPRHDNQGETMPGTGGWYTIDGRQLSAFPSLPKGIYIVNGKKVVVK